MTKFVLQAEGEQGTELGWVHFLVLDHPTKTEDEVSRELAHLDLDMWRTLQRINPEKYQDKYDSDLDFPPYLFHVRSILGPMGYTVAPARFVFHGALVPMSDIGL